MGLPEINIEFVGKAVSAIKRSQLGIVALVLEDDTNSQDTMVYKSVEEIVSTDWTPENLDLIQKTFLEAPSKVIVERKPTTATDYNDVLKRLNNKRFNYLAIPQIKDTDTTLIATWIKTKRENDKRTFRVVLPNTDADHEGVINFTAEDIKVGEKVYSTAEYTVRIAGILAALPFTRSSTYFVLPEVESIKEVDDPNATIDDGELILINDGEKVKIGRGVNSLVTTSSGKTEDFKSIRIVEIMDLIKDDIRSTYNDHYVGKYPNIYDNQVLFITAVNAYLSGLAAEDILDPNALNRAEINVVKQRLAWERIGIDTSGWDDQTVKVNSFKRNVFLRGNNIKIVDAMEDLDFEIEI